MGERGGHRELSCQLSNVLNGSLTHIASSSLAACGRRGDPVLTIPAWSEVEVLTPIFDHQFGYI